MTLTGSVRLIPRNNWDYGLGALAQALAPAASPAGRASSLEAVYHQPPIWTRSGRVSLYAILKALDLPAGAAVGVPLFCCSVVFNAIWQAGLRPCFIDSNLEDFNLSVADLERKAGGLAAVVAVHMFGNPCDLDGVTAAAGSRPVIEDCAQSLFSRCKDKLTGTLSSASFFSFRCGKYLSAGEGSAILCRDAGLRGEIERLAEAFPDCSRLAGARQAVTTFVKAALYHRPWYGLVGYPLGMALDKKFNLTAKCGFATGKIASPHRALIDARLPRFEEKIGRQREHARLLLELLEPGAFSLPRENEGCSSNWFQFPLCFDDPALRDRMAEMLFQQGIDTARYLDGIAVEAAASYGYRGDCPAAERLSRTVLLVPVHYTLRTRDIEFIARSINWAGRRIASTGGR